MSHAFSEDKGFSNNKTKDQLHQQATLQKQSLGQIDPLEAELNILDDDYMMSSPFRICEQCGIDHSFKPNFERTNTSIEIIFKLLGQKNYRNIKTHQGVG
jgi:hypothetical protein